MACLNEGEIPIFVSAGNFEGSFQQLLDKEAALLGMRSASELTKLARILSKRLILFLDGYNECVDDLQLNLTRSLKAFSIRYDASIVISTQQNIVRSDLLIASTVVVKRPSAELKASIANITANDTSGNLNSLLAVTNSGLEAALVGHVGATLLAGASKFDLFNSYARIKLGVAASEGIKVLTLIAETLVYRACFSLSVREFDRLCDGTTLVNLDRQQLVREKLLHVRGDRISFVHELFFSAFAAEVAIRSANGNAQRICAALDSPRFFSSKVFILGAIEDDRVLQEVLRDLHDHTLLSACSRGECGAIAQLVVKRRVSEMLDAMVAEAQNVDFHFIGEGLHGIETTSASIHPELKFFGSYLCGIGDGLMRGEDLGAVMRACRKMDDAIATFTAANAAEAKVRNIPLRHGIFSAAYVTHRGAAISQLVNYVRSGGMPNRHNDMPGFGPAINDAWEQAETLGQFYFLIGLTKFTSHSNNAAPHIAKLLRNVRILPYHLQLDLIDFAQYIRDAEEPYRTEIVEALQAALDKLGPVMNTIIFEALNALGALEDDEQNFVPAVRNEILSALSSDSDESDSVAWGLFSCQFDHPFDSVYCDEIQSLDEPRKKLLLTKACRGAHLHYVSFIGILIRQLCEFKDCTVAPAISRWTTLPEKSGCMPQDAVEVFVSAHEALGSLGAELPSFRGESISEADSALLACGELFYWASRAEIIDVETSSTTLAARSILLGSCQKSGAGLLKLTTSMMRSADGTPTSLVRKYPVTSAEICRRALASKGEQISYFEHGFQADPDAIACFAIQVLGEVGGLVDLEVLREHCDDKQCGTNALAAVKKIEERHRFRSA
jgi:hypothetical protein